MALVRRSIQAALLIGSLVACGQAVADEKTSPKTAQTIVAEYRSEATTSARSLAHADQQYALAQLALARAEVNRLIGEIRIEGAESVDIGGEVRAARMTEAAWERAAQAVSAYLELLDSRIAAEQ